MSFLPRLFKFKELLSTHPALNGHTRLFKVVHPSDDYPEGGVAFTDGVSDAVKATVTGLWKESTTALPTTKQPV
jgi:hypothetical protein